MCEHAILGMFGPMSSVTSADIPQVVGVNNLVITARETILAGKQREQELRVV